MTIKPYSIELSGTKKEGETGTYVAVDSDKIVGEFESYPQTVYQLFINTVAKVPNNDFLGTRQRIDGKLGDYVFETYSEIHERVKNFSNGLEYLAQSENLYKNKELKTVGIYSNNRTEWIISDLANTFRSFTTVALYNTYGLDVLNYVATHSEIEVLILSAEKLFFLKENNITFEQVKVLISMDELEDKTEFQTWASDNKLKLFSFNEVELLGKSNTFPFNPPSPDSIYTICYTSGTTGRPKGVISTHSNYAASGFLKELVYGDVRPVTGYSYLPLAHTLERSNLILAMHYEGRFGFSSGSILNFTDDLQALKPTLFPAVPRVLTKVYDAIQAACIHHPKADILKLAIKEKIENFKAGKGVKSEKWDAIFIKFREAFGGNVDTIGFGSAPITQEAKDVLSVCLSANMFESYGATETSSNFTATSIEDTDNVSVGIPFKNIQVKLVDIPDMGYYSTDKPHPRGEVCVKGFNVFKGYYKDEKTTSEVLTQDGWYKTGDIGKIDELGRMHIIDRKSNMFKLSQGEYIASERVENELNKHPAVLQSLIYGNSLYSYIVAVIIPDPENFIKWTKMHPNNEELTIEEAYKHEGLQQKLLEELKVQGKQAGLAGFEIVKYIHVHPTPFSIENGFLTDTYKVKRKVAYKEFESVFDNFYKN